MSRQEDEFLKTLRATFKVEAEEHLQTMAACLLELEKAPPPGERVRLVETVFRAAHSLKGAARAVNFTEIELICQSLEDVFAAWKREQSAPPPPALDTAHRALNAITTALATPGIPPGTVQPPRPSPEPAGVEAARAQTAPLEVLRPLAAGPTEKAPVVETVRIPVAKLNARVLEAEELLTAKLTADQRVSELRKLADRFAAWKKAWAAVQSEARALRTTIDRPAPTGTDVHTAPAVARLLEFFDWNVDFLKTLENQVAILTRTAQQDGQTMGKLVDELLEDSKQLLMVPLSTLSALFPKLVRDLCRDQGKEADLAMRGEEVEIDKRIIEEMKDPLIHLLRNCVDHGVETPEQRTRVGKPSRATITLAVTPVNGNKVEILVSDDGAGIDVEKVKESALKHGFLSAEEARRLGEAESLALIFHTDVTTSPIITQLSGRGLGLAIVREKTEKLGGQVAVESRRGVGTTIRIVLPLTLATFRGILVEAAGRLFVVPTAQVERVARVRAEDIQTVEGRETISLGGRAVALAHLADALELPRPPRTAEAPAPTPVVVLGAGDQRVAFVVDAVLDEQEVLVKRLPKPLARVRNIAGATVLGSGQVAPILNVADLLKSARKSGGAASRLAAGPRAEAATAKSILVVEDSITSRMLLKNILESAGYRVKTAVDGVDAFTTLREVPFDLVVSDVQMPRMDGFDLTAKIRADKKLAELPVVLVTALETREDRERGIDVGANAYIVKSSFDQSNLLEAVRRLA
ncbi:MAG: hybrid sensor histidine kinase/response regulator [Verrucomicrobia bacterium]|nr:hybrid sensor histidine kinase/response regulator [Verrucomicrobiota bacterium]